MGALWPAPLRYQRDFQVFGGEFLGDQKVELLRGFFDAFFQLETARLRNAPAARDGSGPGLHTLHWTEGLATRAGYPTCVIVDHVRSLFRFLEGEEVHAEDVRERGDGFEPTESGRARVSERGNEELVVERGEAILGGCAPAQPPCQESGPGLPVQSTPRRPGP